MQQGLGERQAVSVNATGQIEIRRGIESDTLDTSMFPGTPAPPQKVAAHDSITVLKVVKTKGVFPILQHLGENLVADLKFFTKLIARCSAGSAALCAYSRVPHLALVAALLNIGLSIISDICDKELRERQELVTKSREQELLQKINS